MNEEIKRQNYCGLCTNSECSVGLTAFLIKNFRIFKINSGVIPMVLYFIMTNIKFQSAIVYTSGWPK